MFDSSPNAASPVEGSVLAVTDESFAGVIEGASGVSVVDFGAEWCGPCRMMAPIVEQLAGELAGRARIAKLDVDANPRTAARFNARSLPTFLIFKDGKEVDRVVGAMPKPLLERKIQQHL